MSLSGVTMKNVSVSLQKLTNIYRLSPAMFFLRRFVWYVYEDRAKADIGSLPIFKVKARQLRDRGTSK